MGLTTNSLTLWALCVAVIAVGGVNSVRGIDFSFPLWTRQREVCEQVPAGRVEWIIYKRNDDYGWGENTHRANIALAVNRYRGTDEEMSKMEMQLEMELIKALFRNGTSLIHENDLALYIHALMAINKNPHNFYGTDLVSDLLNRVDTSIRSNRPVHPFLVLTLCNSDAVAYRHLESITYITNLSEPDHLSIEEDGRVVEMKALALKAYSCAASRSRDMLKFSRHMKKAATCLTRRQKDFQDGTFGNEYTTSLSVQALIAYEPFVSYNGGEPFSWNEKGAIEFLLKESVIDVNMVKAYYIEMALNARNITFIKDLYSGPKLTGPEDAIPKGHFIQYSLKNDEKPDFYFSLTIKVDPSLNFFDIMQEAAKLSDRFRFDYTMTLQNLPMLHSVSGTANDAEENMFWRLCRQTLVDHTIHTSKIQTFRDSPVNLIPVKDEHILLWYRNSACPEK